jgi:hypothetical protein
VRVWRTRIPSLALCGAARLQSPRHYPGILRPIPRLRALEEFPSLRRPCVIFHSLIARVADLLQIAALMQRSKPATCGSLGPAGSSPSVRMYGVCVRNGEPVVSFPSPAIPFSLEHSRSAFSLMLRGSSAKSRAAASHFSPHRPMQRQTAARWKTGLKALHQSHPRCQSTQLHAPASEVIRRTRSLHGSKIERIQPALCCHHGKPPSPAKSALHTYFRGFDAPMRSGSVRTKASWGHRGQARRPSIDRPDPA